MSVVATETTAPGGVSDAQGLEEKTYVQALNAAMHEELTRDPAVFLIGEEVATYNEGGGVFGVSRGLLDTFGPERIRETPISEAGFAGIAIGAALAGMRPVAEFMWVDFMLLALDQILNQAAKIRFMFGGTQTVPVVFRTQGGAGRATGPHHSQSLEALFCHVPGVKVCVPSTPADAKGLLKTAIRDNNPVVFLEHKLLYAKKGLVPKGEYLTPFGKANILREGKHITVVGIHVMNDLALEAADILAEEGIELEVIDPRTLVPYDRETVAASLRKTGRLIATHQAHERGGYATEIIQCAIEDAFDYLDAPPVRLCGANLPIAGGKVLEAAVLPHVETIVEAARALMSGRR